MVRATNKRPVIEQVTNGEVAARLDETAELLARQGANEFRVRAYRRGAETLRAMTPAVAQIYTDGGVRGLTKLPGVGDSLAGAIEQVLTTRRMPLLERLRKDAEPSRVFTTVADIGPKLAERIHTELGIQSLTELEAASWDGRLARVPGMGPKRIRAVRESLAGRFSRAPKALRGPAPRPQPVMPEPTVGELLEIDEEYRRLAERDRLVRVAPRRFNPEGKAWLPILHADRAGQRYTAMFSNTGRAHELAATQDWVVIFRDAPAHSGQWTVITSRLGRLRGRRVVRGREAECAKWYAER
ncbi:MAG TPA: helix-hairpin-helix domain-containing protein [Lacipirellulaceae bacterium]|nr:helix-hairpin-helix domain-containing protein [Lacipirellulaceae bacterium]